MDTTAAVMGVGRSTVDGWREPMVRTVARPLARRTRFSEEQIEALIGLGLFAYAVYRLFRPVIHSIRHTA
jgi:hypothetical protein